MPKKYKCDDDPDIYILTSILRNSYDDAMKRIVILKEDNAQLTEIILRNGLAIPESISAHKEFDDLLNG